MRSMLLLALLFPPSLFAQQSDLIEVNVASVEVVAYDRNGQTVDDLTAADFELVVDGKPAPISNFYAESFQSPQSADTPRTVLFFFDRSAFDQPLTRPHLLRAFDSFVEQFLEGCASCSIGLYTRREIGLVTLSRPTSDGTLLRSLLREEAELQQGPAMASRLALGRLDREDVPMHSMLLRREMFQQTTAVAKVIASAGSMPGRRILALVTSRPFSRPPGVFEWRNEYDAVPPPIVSYLGRDAEPASYDHKRSRTNLESLTALANAAGVSVYPVLTGGPSGVARAASVAGAIPPSETPVLDLDQSELLAGIEPLASDTGGSFHFPTNNFGVALDRIAQDARVYYSLGFRIDPRSRGSRVEVNVRRPGVRVRTRSEVHKLTADAIEALQLQYGYAEAAGGASTFDVKAVPVTKARGRRIVRLDFTIPLNAVSWIPEGDREKGSLRMLVRAVDDRGRESDMIELPIDLVREDEHQPSFAGSQKVELRAIPQELLVVLEDTLTGARSWQTVYVN